MQYPPTELVTNDKGQVYHLGLSPEHVAEKVILVGDQDRVHLVASFFSETEHQSQHREFICATGTYKGKRISVLSTGIGTDNIDIALNELDALFNIDLENRCDREVLTALDIVRIGTCGILQPEIPVHSYILSSHAFGLDNVAHFYQITFSDEEKLLNTSLRKHVSLPNEIQTYAVQASESLTNRMASERTYAGITVTSSGFYGPQGRQLRLKNRTVGLNEGLQSFRHDGLSVVNFEMESSALFAMGQSLGHNCTTICLGIANRPNLEFSRGYQAEMLKLIEYVLDRI